MSRSSLGDLYVIFQRPLDHLQVFRGRLWVMSGSSSGHYWFIFGLFLEVIRGSSRCHSEVISGGLGIIQGSFGESFGGHKRVTLGSSGVIWGSSRCHPWYGKYSFHDINDHRPWCVFVCVRVCECLRACVCPCV